MVRFNIFTLFLYKGYYNCAIMMKNKSSIITGLCLLFIGHSTFGQSDDANKWSIDFQAGLNKPMLPRGNNSIAYPLAGLINGQIGARYMFNPKFGLGLSADFNRFNSSFDQIKYKTQSFGGFLQGYMNIGRVCRFEDWTKRIGLMTHGGFGIFAYTDHSAQNQIPGIDRWGSIVLGVTPMFKLSERVALRTDLSIIGNFRQHNSFDFTERITVAGMDGYYATATVGLSIYLGKEQTHMDWRFENDDLLKRIIALEEDLKVTKEEAKLLGEDVRTIEQKMLDDDNDGVANYLDIEPNTAEGETVNTKGQTVKTPEFDNLIGQGTEAQGLFYTVQLGVFTATIPEQYWKGITPLYRLNIENGTTRYFTGVFHSVDEARVILAQAKSNGLMDSFITAYYKGRRITIAEADLVLATKGKTVLRPKP